VASDPSLTLGCRVKQGRLNVDEVATNPAKTSTLILRRIFCCLLKLIKIRSILVNGWIQDQICSLILDLDISIA